MFFDGWDNMGRTAVTAVVSYLGLVVFLRISGKRTLAKMNAFDFVVTVALGSTLSTIVVSRDVPLSEGLLGLGLLIGLQFAVAWTSVRASAFEDLVKSTPSLLVYRGEVRADQLRRQRVSVSEVRAAVRNAGLPALGDVGAVVLETDGTFSVIPMTALSAGEALEGLDTSGEPSAAAG